MYGFIYSVYHDTYLNIVHDVIKLWWLYVYRFKILNDRKNDLGLKNFEYSKRIKLGLLV